MSARKRAKNNTVQITIKYANFNTITGQMTLVPCSIKDIFDAGVKLLEKNWTKEPVRLLGISLSGFQNENQQISLFDLDEREVKIDEKTDKKIDSLEEAILKIRKKYGTDIIKPGISHKKE